MMLRLLVFTLITVCYALAHDLRKQAEFFHFTQGPLKTQKQLKKMVKNDDWLRYLRCDFWQGRDFFSMEGLPQGKDNLIIYDQRQRKILYSDLMSRRRIGNYQLRQIRNDLNAILKTPSGQKLISAILKSPYPIFINGFTGSPAMFLPRKIGETRNMGMHNAQAAFIFKISQLLVQGLYFDQIGSGGEVRYSPGTMVQSIGKKGKAHQVSSAIVLAHELFHALESQRGLLELGMFIRSTQLQANPIAEYRAVAFENQLRVEMGLPIRSTVSQTYSTPDMLNTQGVVPYISPICL